MTPNNARESPKSRQGQRAVGAEIRTSKAKTATPTVESSGPVVAADPELSAEAAKARRAEAAGSSTFPGAACFVGVVWVVLMAATLMLIYQHHTCVPYVEDWSLFPVVVGEQPINLTWLWAQEWEHRPFLARLIAGGLLKLAHGDYWMLMLFCTLPLGALAWVLVRVSRRLRGRIQYADAFLPVALLHWYMGNYLIWGVTLFYQLPTLMAIAMLAMMLRWGIQMRLGPALAAGLCLVVLPLCAAGGMVYLPPFMLWLFLCGLYSWRSPGWQHKAAALVLGVAIVAALLLVRLYFSNYNREQHYSEPAHDVRLITKMTLAFLTISFGQSASSFWPYSGYLLLLLLGASAGLLLVAIWRRPGPERWRALGLLIFLGATLVMALGVSWGRSGQGFEYIWTYWLLPVPFLLCLFFVWELYAPRSLGYFVQMCLFAGVCVTATLNVRQGLEILAAHKTAVDGIEKGVRDGMPAYQLVATYGNAAGLSTDLRTAEALEQMRRAKLGFFADMQPNPPFRVVPLENLTPIDMSQMEQDPETGAYSGSNNSCLTLALPEPMFVAAIRITLEDVPPSNPYGVLYVTWRQSGAADFPAEAPYWKAGMGSLAGETTPTVAQTIDQIRIYPNSQPFRCKLVSVELLVPDTPAGEAK